MKHSHILSCGGALAASLVLAGIHAYLGFHVVKRGVIFVDLSLAQIAALGLAVAIMLNLHDHPLANYLFPMIATFIAAVIFAWLRHLERRVPLEAFIGITFATAQALVMLVLEKSPSGTDHLKETLVGSIFTVAPATVIKTAVIYSVIGIIHFLIRKPLFQITNDPQLARKEGPKSLSVGCLILWNVRSCRYFLSPNRGSAARLCFAGYPCRGWCAYVRTNQHPPCRRMDLWLPLFNCRSVDCLCFEYTGCTDNSGCAFLVFVGARFDRNRFPQICLK